MKKILIRTGVLLAVFILGVAGFSCLMNSKTTDNKTDLETAVIPGMAMQIGGMEVNRMYGYAEDMQTDSMRDTLTPVGTDKTLTVSINPNGREIKSLVYELRSSDGSKVIENNKISKFQKEENGNLTAQFTLQKSTLMNQEYPLVFTLNTDKGSWNYYTRVIQRAGLSTEKYIEFVDSFYKKTFSKENKGDLSTYIEPDETAGNNNFNNINIHSSAEMITWGDLAPEISRPGIPSIKDINENTGSLALTYYITAENENEEVEHYQVDEFYRMRYDQTRIRLLDFERSAKQILTTEQNIVQKQKLNLGVTGKTVEYMADSEGIIVAFAQQGDLWSYNAESNKVTRIFSFRDMGSNDERNDYSQHDIQIVRVEKNGDIDFIVYGYMNRGEHEGYVGTGVYHYCADQNVIEEKFFLTSEKSYEFLQEDIEQLSYVSKDGNLYLILEDALYCINMEDKSYEVIQEGIEDNCLFVSENGRYVAWIDGMDRNNANAVTVMDMEKNTQKKIQAGQGEKLRLFGFINNDVVYGIAKEEDIKPNASGGTDFAMYEVRIQNAKGELVKNYKEDGYYVLNVDIQDSLLELERAQKNGDTYIGTGSAQIFNNVRSQQTEGFSVVTTTTVRQAGITGIQFTGENTVKEPLVAEAKFVKTTEDNVLNMEIKDRTGEEYYVYAKGRLWDICESPSAAIKEADEQAGVVLNQSQRYVWERGNDKEQAEINVEEIPQPVKSGSMDISQINEDLKEKGKVIDMTGCTLEEVLYELSMQRPVIVKGEEGKTQLLIGFDSYNTRIYDPSTQKTKYLGINDSKKLFEENGNVFFCYIEEIQE